MIILTLVVLISISANTLSCLFYTVYTFDALICYMFLNLTLPHVENFRAKETSCQVFENKFKRKKKKVSFSFVYSMKGLMEAIMKSAVKNIHSLKKI